MAVTPSTMLPLGTKAPNFLLPDTLSEKMMTLEEIKSPIATVIMFICNHCPYVQHISKELVKVSNDYLSKGIHFVAINANDAQKYPQDGPEQMKLMAEKLQFHFPYLFDETQKIAKAYAAACTPDFYIFDKNLLCVYRGRFDDSSPGKSNPVTGNDLKAALDNILADKPVKSEQFPSLGCNIKWKLF